MVERLLAGHRDGKRAAVVDCLDLLDERLRLVVVASATGTMVAWRSAETSPALGLSRYVLARPGAAISPSSTKSRTKIRIAAAARCPSNDDGRR